MKKNTLILAITAIFLVTVVYFWETIGKKQNETIQLSQKQIFNFHRDEIQSLSIEKPDITLTFERINLEKWKMIFPQKKLANNASVSFLVHLLTVSQKNKSFVTSEQKLGEYGLDKPQGIITIILKNQQKYKLILGKRNFDNSLLYAVNKTGKNAEIEVLLVPIDFEYGINRELKEWEAQK